MSSFFYFILAFSSTTLYSLSAHSIDNQAWTIIRKSIPVKSKIFVSQLQHRYSEDENSLYEEQLNLGYHSIKKTNRYALLFTLGTNDFYSSLKEFRLGFEYEKMVRIQVLGSYRIRFRQEIRDFNEFSKLAFRFRIRNQITKKISKKSLWSIRVSNEINIYQNDFINDVVGLSSIRTIIGIKRDFTDFKVEIAYLYDDQLLETTFDRQALQVSLLF